MEWQAVFWDFDGVIIDSVDVKTDAFAQMYRKYGSEVERCVVDFHLSHMGVSRYDKFKYFQNEILEIPLVENQLDNLCEEFSKLVFEEVVSSDLIPGALDALKMLKREEIPAFVITGTPTEEIHHIIHEIGLKEYFLEIHGSPKSKEEILIDIIRRRGYQPGSCLFLGDAMTDYEASNKVGTQFLGVVADQSKSPFPTGTRISDVVRLQAIQLNHPDWNVKS